MTTKPRPIVLKPGTRVMFVDGRMATIERHLGRHAGVLVRFDEKANSFERDVCRVQARDLTPTDPKLHARWESAWPSFIDRRWTEQARR